MIHSAHVWLSAVIIAILCLTCWRPYVRIPSATVRMIYTHGYFVWKEIVFVLFITNMNIITHYISTLETEYTQCK